MLSTRSGTSLNQLLEELAEDKLRSTLFVGFQNGDFTPFELTSEPSPELQLQRLFLHSTPHSQEKFKRAVVHALGEWRAGAQPPQTFCSLSHLALDIGASDAVSLIARRVRLGEHDPSELNIALVGVLAGFVPLPEARSTLERLQATALGEATAAILLNGLCRCDPEAFPRHLTCFFEVARRSDEKRFRLGLVLSELIRTVGLRRLNANMGRLSGPDFEWFVELAKDRVFPKLTLAITEHTQVILFPALSQQSSNDNEAFEPPNETPTGRNNRLRLDNAFRRQLGRNGGLRQKLTDLANVLDQAL